MGYFGSAIDVEEGFDKEELFRVKLHELVEGSFQIDILIL